MIRPSTRVAPMLLPTLRTILETLPDEVTMTDVLAWVNQQCGLPRDAIPTPLTTYGWSAVFDAMVDLGYRADGKGTWTR